MKGSQEFSERYPVGDVVDAQRYFAERRRYEDTYLIFFQRPSKQLEHIGTMTHYRITTGKFADVVTAFIMRGKYGTFGCVEAVDGKAYSYSKTSAKMEKRVYLASRVFQKCEDDLEQLGIHVRNFQGFLNSDWIDLFEKAGYKIFHLSYNPEENPFGIQTELEKVW